jgi:hypothetical protein
MPRSRLMVKPKEINNTKSFRANIKTIMRLLQLLMR